MFTILVGNLYKIGKSLKDIYFDCDCIFFFFFFFFGGGYRIVFVFKTILFSIRQLWEGGT